jgi:hypothetical protein
MTPWQEWKANNLAKQEAGIVSPLALFNPDSPKADDELQQSRLDICSECPNYMITKQCSKCGCHMPSKTKLLHATCPINLW